MDIKRYDVANGMARVVVHNKVAYFTDHVAASQYKTVEEQAAAVLARYDELFARFGFSKDHILYSFVYLSDYRLWQAVEPIYNGWIGENPPAISAIEAHCTSEDRLIAITFIVAVD